MKDSSRFDQAIANCHSRLLPAFGALALSVSLTQCSRDRSGDVPLPWSLERGWTLGSASGIRTFDELMPFQLGTLDSISVYVLDSPNHRVIVANGDGVVTDSLGREGRGPGELADPIALEATDSEIGVLDVAARRVIGWTRDGRLLAPVSVRGIVEHPLVVVRGEEVRYVTSGPGSQGRSEYRLVSAGPAGTRVIATLAKQPRRVGDFPSCHATDISVQPLFAPVIQWAARGDRMAVNATVGYSIDLFKRDRHVATLTRPVPAVTADEQAAERAAEGWRLNGCLVPPKDVVRVAGFLTAIPVIRSLALAPGGELWVLRATGARPEDGVIDIFAPTGTYLGTLPSGTPFPAAFLGDHRMLTIETDSLDLSRVVSFEIHRRF